MPTVTVYTAARMQEIEDRLSFTKIAEIDLAAPSALLEFANIPSDFKTLKLLGSLRSTSAALIEGLNLNVNNNANDGSYYRQYLQGNGATTTSQEALAAANSRQVGLIPGATSPASSFAQIEITLIDYIQTGKFKPIDAKVNASWGPSSGNLLVRNTTILSTETNAINRLALALSAGGSFAVGSTLSIYGITSAFG